MRWQIRWIWGTRVLTGFGSGAAFWGLWAKRVRVRVQDSGVRAYFPWCPVCLQVVVQGTVSCVVRCGVMESSPVGELLRGGVHVSCRTCESVCWRK